MRFTWIKDETSMAWLVGWNPVASTHARMQQTVSQMRCNGCWYFPVAKHMQLTYFPVGKLPALIEKLNAALLG